MLNVKDSLCNPDYLKSEQFVKKSVSVLFNHVLEHSIFYLHPCYGGQIPKPYRFYIFGTFQVLHSKVSIQILSAALKNILTDAMLEFVM